MYSLENNEFEVLVYPLMVMTFFTYFISTVFLGLFDEIIMAILMCIAVDMDLNNGRTAFGPPQMHI